jgi:hypothetical protein
LLGLFLVSSGGGLFWGIVILFGLQVGTEDVDAVLSSGEQHLAVMGVESELLDVLLALVQEHKLGWDLQVVDLLRLLVIHLDGEVPDGKLVVG